MTREDIRIRGARGCGGTAVGPVRLVGHGTPAHFERHAVFVAHAAEPTHAPVIAAAAAAVFERDDEHARVLLRELGIPAVTGVLGAREALRDGDAVEVDGSEADVHVLELAGFRETGVDALRPLVLFVGGHSRRWRALSDKLADEGFRLIVCSGAEAPAYACPLVARYTIEGTAKMCPLARRASVVLVDCVLDSDVAEAGTPSWHLIEYYRALELPVVALGDDVTYPAALRADGVKIAAPDREDLAVAAARAAC